MKRLTLLIACAVAFIIGSFVIVHASPFLVCNPQPGEGVEWYVVSGLPREVEGAKVPVDTTGTYGFKLDLAAIPAGGPYTVKARACKTQATWGEVCTVDSLPFEFSRPLPSTVPAAPRLVK